jgi:hypothetical protein
MKIGFHFPGCDIYTKGEAIQKCALQALQMFFYGTENRLLQLDFKFHEKFI